MQAYRHYLNHLPRKTQQLVSRQWLTVAAIQLRASSRRRAKGSRTSSVTNTHQKLQTK